MAKRKRTKWPKRYTKHTHNTKDRVTQTPQKIGVNSGVPVVLACSATVVTNVWLSVFAGFFFYLRDKQVDNTTIEENTDNVFLPMLYQQQLLEYRERNYKPGV
jgi:hypothetical protein